ncbi:MAG: 1,4-dihydroxy-2-naphthoate octaprenyltransferase [Coriobacteriales bacterium]|nr:1,4-dihydroxy-2-naphthoate octaprenyltransferase [Coriobacteriales bacterium]
MFTAQEKRQAWIEATRPRTLPLAAAGSVVAAAIAASMGVFRWPVFILMFITSILLQIIANFADDYGDLKSGLDDETRVGPKRGLQRGVITFDQMKRALIGTCVLAFITGVALILVAFSDGPETTGSAIVSIIIFILLGAAAIAAAILYTMGSHPYGYIGLGDIVSFIFFGLVAVIGGTFLYAHELVGASIVGGIALGLPVMAVMNVNNMRDAKADAAKGKRTIANMLGDPKMRIYETILLAASAVLFVVTAALCGMKNPVSYILLILSYSMWLMVLVKMWKIPNPENFDKLMQPTSLGSVIVSLVFLATIAFIG